MQRYWHGKIDDLLNIEVMERHAEVDVLEVKILDFLTSKMIGNFFLYFIAISSGFTTIQLIEYEVTAESF